MVQYAAATYVTPADVDSFDTVHTYWSSASSARRRPRAASSGPGARPTHGDYQLLDAYPNGGGFVVQLQLKPDDPRPPVDESTALNQPIAVYANCVKSRKQHGAPPT